MNFALGVSAGGLGGLYALNKYYFSGPKCTLPGRLDGKLVVITGANNGLGKETTAEVARRGARVIMACRSEERANEAKDYILNYYGEGKPTVLTRNIADASVKQYLSHVKPDQLIIEIVDLASLESIRAFSKRVLQSNPRIDFLVNNAGIFMCPYGETKEGFELQMGTNHLGHFFLTELLLPAIKRAGPGSRIINVSSLAHYKATLEKTRLTLSSADYQRMPAYRRSKLANAIHARQLSKRLVADGVLTASLHPGVIATELFKVPALLSASLQILTRPFFKTTWEGIQTTLHTILTPDLVSGGYYSDCALKSPSPLVEDDELGEWVWEESRKAVYLAENN